MIFKAEPIKSVVAYEANGELCKTIEEARASLALDFLKKKTYAGKGESRYFDEQKFIDHFDKIMDEMNLIRWSNRHEI